MAVKGEIGDTSAERRPAVGEKTTGNRSDFLVGVAGVYDLPGVG